MKLCALVVAYNSQATIGECVAQALASGVDSIVIVDNSAEAQTGRLVEALNDRRITYVPSDTNIGFGAGVNLAAQFAPAGARLLLLNPDCILNGDAVQKMLTILDSSPGAVVAPRMQYPSGSFGIAGGPRPSLLKEIAAWTRIDDLLPARVRSRILQMRWRGSSAQSESYGSTMIDGEPIEVSWVSGFCMLLSKVTFDGVGGFDEDYFMYFEDVDLCERVVSGGGSAIVVRSASVLHYESLSSDSRGKSSLYYQGLQTYIAKHGSRFGHRVALLLGGRS